MSKYKEKTEIIRCQECRHGVPEEHLFDKTVIRCTNPNSPCSTYGWRLEPDYFCADGERKVGE